MTTGKPLKLIELLEQLIAETDKMNIGKIYIAITEEIKKLTFVETAELNSELVYKHLVRLSIKDFIHSGRSEDSADVIKDVIGVLSRASVS